MVFDVREILQREDVFMSPLHRLEIELHDVRFDQIGEKQMREGR